MHTNESFILKAIKTHGNLYDYSLVKYLHGKSKVEILCKKHGLFKQTPMTHLQGRGCAVCGIESRTEKRKQTKEDFVRKSNKKHLNRYDYSLVEYKNSHTKIKIICPKHGKFEQRPYDHYLQGKGCPICNESKGETKIREFLTLNKINFEIQKSFERCKNLRKLKFDFFLPEKKILIEFDGKQHFESDRFYAGNDELVKIQKRDEIKTNFAIENSFKLIRIPYFDMDKIEITLQNNIH